MVITGAKLGKYQLEEAIGSSGLATVYRAYDPVLDRPVALKVLHAYFAHEEELVRPFFHELAIIAQWHHPNIVPIYDFGQDGDTWWVATELVQGISLKEYPALPIPIEVAAYIVGEVAEALKFAHQQGIIHRDIKPSNVFVTSDGRVLLSDFAMATLGERVHPLIKTSLTTPMPSFMSPEHASGDSVDPRADIYSLGTLLYWMLTDSVPYVAESPATVYVKQMSYAPFAPSQLNPDLPKKVDHILLKALAPFPTSRYQNLDELVEDFTSVAGGKLPPALDFPAYLSGEKAAGELFLTPPAAARRDTSGILRPRISSMSFPLLEKLYAEGVTKRGREVAIVAATAVLLALAVTGGMFYRSLQPPPPLPPPSTNVSSDSPSYQWTMSRNNIANTGFAPWAPSLTGELKWTYSTNTSIQASPTVFEGKVFLSTGDSRILALDASTGKLLWESATTGPVDSSPTVADGLLYVGLRDSRLLAIETATGRLRWEFMTGNPITTTVVVSEGVLYLASGDGWLYALDAATGDFRWKFEVGGWIHSSPGVRDGKVVVGGRDGEVYVLDAANGQKLFAFDVGNEVSTAPTLADDKAYVSSYQRIWALDLKARSAPWDRQVYWLQLQLFVWGLIPPPPPPKGAVWTHKVKGSNFSSPALANGTVFAGTEKGSVYAWDAVSGETKWEFKAKGPVLSPPSIGKDTLYIGSDDGYLYALDVTTGEKRWEFATKGKIRASPAITQDALYVASYDGKLYALK